MSKLQTSWNEGGVPAEPLLATELAAQTVSLPPTWYVKSLAGLTVGIVAAVPYVMIAMFPRKSGFRGISFSYNIACAIFGGLIPVVVTWLLRFDRLAPRIMSEPSACWARESESLLGCEVRLTRS
jgi:hypothetical protein